MLPATFACVDAQSAGLLPLAGVVGRKPAWNQPQAMCRSLRRSPTFRPVIVILADVGARLSVQSSSAGRGSPMTDPRFVLGSIAVTFPAALPNVSVAPQVWPAMRLRAPGVDGPNVVLKELSLIAKC